MIIRKRIEAFAELGDFIKDFLGERKNIKNSAKYEMLDHAVGSSFTYNGWFTRENVLMALRNISSYLNEKDLSEFSKQIREPSSSKTVAVIMAGNIPMVGFHDFLCVLLSGNKILVKNSSDDKLLIPFLAKVLVEIAPEFTDFISFAEGKLQGFDAVIATGSDNSASYFKQYFGKYPHLIRKNRSSVAVLSGKETMEELALLGHDIFDYFGLGCRSVSKLYVPRGYKFDSFYESIFSFADVMDNKKYANNHDYYSAIYLLNQHIFLDNNFLIVKESADLHSPVSVLYYEEYSDLAQLTQKLTELEPELQCIVTNIGLSVSILPLGTSQCPTLFNFADNVNTLSFLNKFH
ncbi:MAG: acyl-CoA reductase [Bacteroidia bacterium]